MPDATYEEIDAVTDHLHRIANALERIAAVMEAEQKVSHESIVATHTRLSAAYDNACAEFERYERSLSAAINAGNTENQSRYASLSGTAEHAALDAEARLRDYETAHPWLLEQETVNA